MHRRQHFTIFSELETLGLRMERACSNALELAKHLEEYNDLTVNYPGLESSQYGMRQLTQQFYHNGFGAIITVRVGSKERAFSDNGWSLKIPKIVSNIGDTKTLISSPCINAYMFI